MALIRTLNIYESNLSKIRELNRECRKQRIQRNHIACAMLVWARLKQLAYQTGETVYQIKKGLFVNNSLVHISGLYKGLKGSKEWKKIINFSMKNKDIKPLFKFLEKSV